LNHILPRCLGVIVCAAATLGGATAYAQFGEVGLEWRGFLMSDLRLFADEDLAFERSETTANVHLAARLDPHVAAVGDVSLIFTEASTVRTFGTSPPAPGSTRSRSRAPRSSSS
jgi:hypothetical protein